MISSKYTKDYSVSYELSARGRLVPTATYAGSYYRFVKEPAEQAAARKRLILLLVPTILAMIVLLSVNRVFPQVVQIWLMPVFLSVIPMAFVVLGVWRIFTAKEPFIHKRRDQIENRFPPALLFFMIFCAVGFATSVVALILAGFTVPRLLYVAGVLVLAALSVFLFGLRGCWKTEELPKTEEEDPASEASETADPPAPAEPEAEN